MYRGRDPWTLQQQDEDEEEYESRYPSSSGIPQSKKSAVQRLKEEAGKCASHPSCLFVGGFVQLYLIGGVGSLSWIAMYFHSPMPMLRTKFARVDQMYAKAEKVMIPRIESMFPETLKQQCPSWIKWDKVVTSGVEAFVMRRLLSPIYYPITVGAAIWVARRYAQWRWPEEWAEDQERNQWAQAEAEREEDWSEDDYADTHRRRRPPRRRSRDTRRRRGPPPSHRGPSEDRYYDDDIDDEYEYECYGDDYYGEGEEKRRRRQRPRRRGGSVTDQDYYESDRARPHPQRRPRRRARRRDDDYYDDEYEDYDEDDTNPRRPPKKHFLEAREGDLPIPPLREMTKSRTFLSNRKEIEMKMEERNQQRRRRGGRRLAEDGFNEGMERRRRVSQKQRDLLDEDPNRNGRNFDGYSRDRREKMAMKGEGRDLSGDDQNEQPIMDEMVSEEDSPPIALDTTEPSRTVSEAVEQPKGGGSMNEFDESYAPVRKRRPRIDDRD